VRGNPHYPPDHLAAMPVPIGGSMCLNCRFLGADKQSCKNKDFIAWEGPDKPAGSDRLPKPPDRYCSDWYMPASRLAQDFAHRRAES
jgi:hypothetical protein